MTNVITSYLPSPRCIWSVLLGNFSCLLISGLMLIFRSSRYDEGFLSLSPSMLTEIRAATSQHVRWKPHQPSPHTWHSDISTLCQTLPGSWREVTMTNNNIVNFIRSLMLQLQINLHLSVKVLSHCSLYCKKNIFIELISSILQR